MTSFGDFNLYEELEISKEATPEEIKKAYKKLAMVNFNFYIVNIFRNGILIKILMIQLRPKSFKEFHIHIQSCQTRERENIMINMEK